MLCAVNSRLMVGEPALNRVNYLLGKQNFLPAARAFSPQRLQQPSRTDVFGSAAGSLPKITQRRSECSVQAANARPQFSGQWRAHEASSSAALLEEAREMRQNLDAFFLKTEFKENPFADALDKLEHSRAFRRQSNDYERSLVHSTPAKITVSLMGTMMAMGAYYVSRLTNSPVMGILAGGITSPLLDTLPRKAMKRWFPPSPLIQREKDLQQLDDEIQKGRLVSELGEVWPRLSFKRPRSLWHPASFDWHPGSFASRYPKPEEPVLLMLMALISRYPAQQDALKAALPNMKGKALTRQKILPVLRAIEQPAKLYGSVHREPNALMLKAVDGMLAYVDKERQLLDSSPDRGEERQKYIAHLQKVLPQLIDYLEG